MAKPTKLTKRRMQKNVAHKKCYFCSEKKDPDFADVAALRRFLTERGKIVPRSRNGLCTKHQRGITHAIKYARHLALLAFNVKI